MLQLVNDAGIEPDDSACHAASPLNTTELVSPAHNPCCSATASGASMSHGNGLCSRYGSAGFTSEPSTGAAAVMTMTSGAHANRRALAALRRPKNITRLF